MFSKKVSIYVKNELIAELISEYKKLLFSNLAKGFFLFYLTPQYKFDEEKEFAKSSDALLPNCLETWVENIVTT